MRRPQVAAQAPAQQTQYIPPGFSFDPKTGNLTPLSGCGLGQAPAVSTGVGIGVIVAVGLLMWYYFDRKLENYMYTHMS